MQKQAESNIAFSHSIMNVSNIYTKFLDHQFSPCRFLKNTKHMISL